MCPSLLFLLLAGCFPGGPDTETGDTDTDTGSDTDSDTDTDRGTDPDSDVDTDTASCGPPSTLEIGVGESAWEPLDTLDVVEVHCGIQGGWHIETSLRGCDVGDTLSADITVTHEASNTLVGRGQYVPFPLLDSGECCRWRGGLWTFLDTTSTLGSAPPVALAGEVLVLHVVARDADQVEHTASVRVVGAAAAECAARR